MCEALT
ncbi:hypothetical protein D038_1226A, partial [Vibrio parahaemolyticus IDH02189]